MLLKGIAAGVAVGADEMSRHVPRSKREWLIEQLSAEAELRASALIAEARTVAAAILAEAESTAASVRAQAHAEGFATGQEAGFAEGLTALDGVAAVVRRAAEEAEAIRAVLLDGAEEQVLELAMLAARQVAGAAAEQHTELAASIVRDGLRATGTRVLRIRVHPEDAGAVTEVVRADDPSITIAPDTAIEAGGCIIDTAGGTVDLRLSTRMARVEQAIRPEA
jgi:flagellar assembly protein FliH